MNKVDGIEHDDGHSANILAHLFDFYKWVLKNCPDIYQTFLTEGAEKK